MAKITSKQPASKIADKQGAQKLDQVINPSALTEKASSLSALFLSELKDTYWAENHLVKSLPKMIAASASANLQAALTEHLELTRTHATRLEKIFEVLGEKIAAKKCDAMEGLSMSGEHAIENTVAGTDVRDTAIIMSGLKVENFEITTYKGLIQVANMLGKSDVASLLQQTLEEEVEASKLLTELSQKGKEKAA